MPIVGPRFPHVRLGRPVVVFGPPFPTQQQQTLTVVTVAGRRARASTRYMPLQGWIGGVIQTTGGTQTFGAPSRLIGPWPPELISQPPTQQQQTIVVTTASIQSRLGWTRRFPPQWYEANDTQDTGGRAVPLPKRALGPDPPQLLLLIPTQQQQTLAVTAIAVQRARSFTRYLSHSSLQPPAVVLPTPLPPNRQALIATALVAVKTRTSLVLRGPHPRYAGPVVVGAPYPVVTQLTKFVQTRASSYRRRTRSFLSPPVSLGVAAPPLAPPIKIIKTVPVEDIRNTAVRRRPIYFLKSGVVEASLQPPDHRLEITVALARTRPRPTTKFLRPPAVLQVFAGPQVSLARIRPRPTTKTLFPPMIVRVESVDLREQTISVTLTHTRPRHTLGTRLAPPVVLQVFSGPAVTFVRARPRPTIHVLHPGVVEPALQPPDRRLTIQVDDLDMAVARAARPRHTLGTKLSPPAVVTTAAVFIASPVSVTLVKTRPRPTTRRLSPPTIVNPLPTQRMQTVQVALVAVRIRIEAQRHAPHSHIAPPTVVFPLPTQKVETVAVTLVSVRTRLELPRHTGRHTLSPPTVIVPLTTLRQQTVSVTLAGRTRLDDFRRASHAHLSPPTVVFPLPTLRVQTVAVTLTRIRPRHTVHVLSPPTAVATPLSQQQQTLTVTLAVKPRLTLLRRGAVYRLSAPTKINPLPTLREQTVKATLVAVRARTEFSRRAPHSRLSKPTWLAPVVTTINATSVAVASRLLRVRVPKSTLRPPGLGVPVGRVASTITAVRQRLDLRRRNPRFFLGKPTVVTPLPTLSMQTIHVWTAWKTRGDAARRAPHYAIFPPTSVVPPPTQSEQTIGVSLVAVKTREDAGRRAPHSHLSPPAVIQPLTNFEFRVSGPLSSAWMTGTMLSGWDSEEPGGDFQTGGVESDMETGPPDTDFKTGRPK